VQLEDDSNNEYIKFSKTATAVNEITVANAATTQELQTFLLQVSDTNIDLNLTAKGIRKSNIKW
jgi:hypothetical protein